MNQVQNQVTLIGYLGSDPEAIGNGENAGAKLNLATNEAFGRGEERKERTDWHDVVCWNGLVKSCEHLAKGDRIAVLGKLRSNSWQDQEGNARRSVEVHASDICFLRVKAFDRVREAA
ncbi:MAG: single-stranded DNA-binding protein [bacterium]|nr:single-stranded DNA-binding protein [bacterium]